MAQTINNSASSVFNYNGGTSETATSNISSVNFQSSMGLEITKTANVETFSAGDIITYTIKITNNSGSYLNGVRIIDNLANGNLAYVLSSASLSTGSTTYPVNPVSTNPLTFTLQQLSSGSSMTLTYKSQVIFNLPQSIFALTNTVQGIGYTATGTISGFASSTIQKKTNFGFSLEKSSSVTDVMSNQPFNYYIKLLNNSNSIVNVSSITDNLPSIFNFMSASLKIGSSDIVYLYSNDYSIDQNNTMIVTSVADQPIVIPQNTTAILTITGYFD